MYSSLHKKSPTLSSLERGVVGEAAASAAKNQVKAKMGFASMKKTLTLMKNGAHFHMGDNLVGT